MILEFIILNQLSEVRKILFQEKSKKIELAKKQPKEQPTPKKHRRPKKGSSPEELPKSKKRKSPTEKKVMTWRKNINTSFAVSDLMEHLHTALLEVPGKVEELTDIIFHLWNFVHHIVKMLGKPPQLTWMNKIKKDDDLYPL